MLMSSDINITLTQTQMYVAAREREEKMRVDQDTVDGAILPPKVPADLKKVPSIETLNSEMPRKELQKDRGKKAIKCLLNRLRLKKYGSATISKPDPVYRVAYLGNVVTGWAKGDGCFEKPLTTLWRNYTQSSRPDVRMQLTVSGGGLKATTKDHGLTEYWANRLTACGAPSQFPRLFCWVYRHEGKRLRHELRCHAVLCSSSAIAKQIEEELKESLALALLEFKREKLCRQNARLSLVNSVYENPTIPRRKILLSTGSHNYRPPLERSKSAPKLMSIEEIIEEEDDVFQDSKESIKLKRLLQHCNSSSNVLDRRKLYILSTIRSNSNPVPVKEKNGDATVNTDGREETEHLMLDEKSEVILNELVENSLKNDLLESCEKAWFNALGQKPDLIPIESDEGSLSSGCESAGTAVSESEPMFPTFNELEILEEEGQELEKKTELDFKVGGAVLSRVRSFERLSNPDLLKYCGINNKKQFLDQEEVSLVPVGETQTDFSSLKVFKRRTLSDPNYRRLSENGSDDENGSACSDESGYEEEEVASSIGNIVLV
ncbi:uncharacterized protein LOC114338271 [Diabrotica virgifera virgifera]|uniref:Uncharacterized protein LOC114338271 n=1 Tax=Diabrotica virgifera virgifera TaxID=50390 RepID=A0A6P7G6G3_DIAVI|nr:uncharacterized protein LOC114338271 [Diabrotica virgifera virgifera]XP_050515328.1 uncharacterized protein LOC114338271 [Diabrotica virgifera virgifera]XP_050515329.1 uncharacterized protein LOC114338271 [Diabrotica virgifera virgifera]XP_050515330.1 uncharacterized protein LOC114338271 [Diabrotica virgifera virgifera]